MALDLSFKVEAILFSEGGPIAKKKLAQLLDVTEEALMPAIHSLAARREGSGMAIIETEREVALAISSEATEVVQKAFERELSREIGDAGLEVLSIVLYHGPCTRARIDYIRGVNTSSTVRTLASRGLIERTANPIDAREYLYRPTPELFAHLGVTKAEELPDYAKISSELAAFEEKKGPFDDHADDGEQPAA